MRASQSLDVDPHGLLHMPEAVATQLLATEPPRNHDDVVPEAFAFKHAKDDHAGSGLAIIALDHLIAADEAPRIVRGLGEFLVVLQFRYECPRLVSGMAWPARDSIFRATIGDDVVKNDHDA